MTDPSANQFAHRIDDCLNRHLQVYPVLVVPRLTSFMNKNSSSPGDYSNNANSNHLEKRPESELSGNVVGCLQICVKRERMTTKPSITPREARSRTSKTNGDAGARFLIARGDRETAPPMQPHSRFNWRGNRPRMGKRSTMPIVRHRILRAGWRTLYRVR